MFFVLKYYNFFFYITILLTFLQQLIARPSRGGYFDDKCVDNKTGRELYVGEAYTRIGECVRVQCLVDLSNWEYRCQIPNLPGNCTQLPATNLMLDFPKCCPLYECETKEENEFGSTAERRTYDHNGNLRSTYLTQIISIADRLNKPNTNDRGKVDATFRNY